MKKRYTLSVLDQSPLQDGCNCRQALENTVRLAQSCEHWGYHRYWVSEHHSAKIFAGSSPEILMTHLASQTTKIRIGSGGVMLRHYSPMKVAENFRVMTALYGNRIDMGIGRASGGNEVVLSELAYPNSPCDKDKAYSDKVKKLLSFLRDDNSENSSNELMPKIDTVPESWILASGESSADLAAELGTGLALALFIGNFDKDAQIIKNYRENFRTSSEFSKPRVAITVPCICKENKQKAIEVAKTYANWVAIYKSRSEITNLVPHSDIKEELMNSDELELFHKSINSIVLGNSEECKQEIDHLAKKYEADEVIIVNVSYHFRDRLETYDRLAKEYKLAQGGY